MKNEIRLYAFAALLAATPMCGVASAQQAQKPNIILIVSDDFGYGDSSPYGGGPGRGMPTPNIERLTNEGMTFFSFYAQPSCTPGRAAMLCSADTKVRGRFSETRCGPSRRCARNASGALKNFACYPQKTFSTASTQSRSRAASLI